MPSFDEVAGVNDHLGREHVGSASLATKINRLVEAARRPGERPLSNKAIAAGVTESGERMSETFVSYLRSGARDNPTKRTIEGLARYFGVPSSYFLDDDPETTASLELLVAMRDSDVRSILMRASELDPGLRGVVSRMIADLSTAQRTGKTAHDPSGLSGYFSARPRPGEED